MTAAGLLAACAPRGDGPPEQSTAQSPDSAPASVTSTPSGLPYRALKADASIPAPPLQLTASDGTGLRLLSLDARASLQEPLAFTELHLTFENPQSRTIEGRFTIDLPPGAAISRFAMKIGDRWQEGEVVERQAARVAYEDFLHRKQDPALMEKQAGNRFSARVFPIPANGTKELIVSYSQQQPESHEPYRLMLAGLPKLDRLDARILVDEPKGTAAHRRTIEVHERDYVPERDLEVVSDGPSTARGIRNDDLALARLSVGGDTPPEPVTDLTILFDTSASRALDFSGQVRRLGALVAALRELEGDFRLRLAAFDQDMSLLFDGSATDFGDEQLQALYARRALGASDLTSALRRASTICGPEGRLLLLTDGVATAGDDDVAALESAAQTISRAGVTRIDAIIDGGLQDRGLLEAITTAGLQRDGIVTDARLPADRLAQKLRHATLPDLELSVPGATWTWPRVVDGVQPGDEVLVYAQMPKDTAMTVVVEGEETIRTEVPLMTVDRPLLHRAWIGARIDALQLQHAKLDPQKDTKTRRRLQDEIVGLSTKHRVLSNFTALLVLESEHDYQRFSIDRRALTDILVVGDDGLQWQHRSEGPVFADADSGSDSNADSGSDSAPAHDAIPQMARNFDPELAGGKAGILGMLSQKSGHFLGAPYGAAFATGNDDEDVWGGLAGTEVGEAFGVGGLGLVGTGRGGGGVGEQTNHRQSSGLIGLGGSNVGYGRGRGAGFGSRARSIPRVRQAKAKVDGAMDKDIVRRIVRAHINEIRYCYNQGLVRDPRLAGRVTIQFTIGTSGKVPIAVATQSTLSDRNVADCMAKAVRRWKFPRPRDGAQVTVTYPFVLSPGDRPRQRLTAEQIAERQRQQQILEQRQRQAAIEYEQRRIEAERTTGSPYEGRMFDVMNALDEGHADQALTLALTWNEQAPGDILAHIALGEILEAQGKIQAAARAYGSLIDLFPARADLRRHAGSRLEALGGSALWMAIDTYTQAVEQRPDHPSSHRMLAFALARVGRHEQAFEAIVTGIKHDYPSGRFAGVDQILREDAALLTAAWLHAEPERATEIRQRAADARVGISTRASTRFVMTWETDSNDVDFHIRDGKSGHAYYASRDLPSGGTLYQDVTTGYGPECFTIKGTPTAFPYELDAHYYSRGPMGYGMGALQIIEHDGNGQLYFEDRPYVIMKDGAEVDLGRLEQPLSWGR
ncbi:MAG: AgmX/PglI C-terminal domain-containing protein [Myxococcota bacterium]